MRSTVFKTIPLFSPLSVRTTRANDPKKAKTITFTTESVIRERSQF